MTDALRNLLFGPADAHHARQVEMPDRSVDFETDPWCAVVPSKYEKALELSETVDAFDARPATRLTNALVQEHTDDAHMASYCLYDPATGGRYAARVRKAVLEGLLKKKVVVQSLVYDWDNPGHEPWARGDDVEARIHELLEKLPQVPAAWYATRSGARFVYVLPRPETPVQAERIYKAFYQECLYAGVEFDPACGQWNRLFRLPKVVRDGEKTWLDHYFCEGFNPSQVFDKDAISDLADLDENAVPIRNPGQAPDPTIVAEKHLKAGGSIYGAKSNKQSAFLKAAKRSLKGHDAFEHLFNGLPLEVAKGRNSELIRLIGSTVYHCIDLVGACPEAVYALWVDRLMELEPDGETSDWMLVGWDMVNRLWDKELFKHNKEQQTRLLERINADNVLAEFLRNIREVYRGTRMVEMSDPYLRDFWMRRAVLRYGKDYFLMQRTGLYNMAVPYAKEMLPGALETNELSYLVDPRDEDGNFVTAQHILNNWTIHAGLRKSVPWGKSGMLVEVGGMDAVTVRIHDLDPGVDAEYFPEVDEWLRLLLGLQYGAVCEWLGFALKVDEPICALMVSGPPSCGKSLLVRGLRANFAKQTVNDERVFRQFNRGLEDNPIISIEEGLGPQEGVDLGKVFRRFVGGDAQMSIEPKGKDPFTSELCPRFVITANNTRSLAELFENIESADDRDAIALRLRHVEACEVAGRWLRERGGREFVDRWVNPRYDGHPLDGALVRHIRWLYENRPARSRWAPQGRLLVEGAADMDYVSQAVMATEAGQRCLYTVAHMFCTPERAGFRHLNGLLIVEAPADVLNTYYSDLDSEYRRKAFQESAFLLALEQLPQLPGAQKDRILKEAGIRPQGIELVIPPAEFARAVEGHPRVGRPMLETLHESSRRWETACKEAFAWSKKTPSGVSLG